MSRSCTVTESITTLFAASVMMPFWPPLIVTPWTVQYEAPFRCRPYPPPAVRTALLEPVRVIRAPEEPGRVALKFPVYVPSASRIVSPGRPW